MLVLAGTLIVEKKSNLLVSGAMWVSVCFGKLSGVFTVMSLLKMLGLCTRRDIDTSQVLIQVKLFAGTFDEASPDLTEYACPQRENPLIYFKFTFLPRFFVDI